MPDNLQERRLAAFVALLDADGSDAEDYDHEVEEDIRPLVAGEKEIGRYICVTMNLSFSEGKLFYLSFNDLGQAISRAEEYDRDDIFEEFPVKVVDLDTGEEHFAEPYYRWRIKGPLVVDQESS